MHAINIKIVSLVWF